MKANLASPPEQEGTIERSRFLEETLTVRLAVGRLHGFPVRGTDTVPGDQGPHETQRQVETVGNQVEQGLQGKG